MLSWQMKKEATKYCDSIFKLKLQDVSVSGMRAQTQSWTYTHIHARMCVQRKNELKGNVAEC